MNTKKTKSCKKGGGKNDDNLIVDTPKISFNQPELFEFSGLNSQIEGPMAPEERDEKIINS